VGAGPTRGVGAGPTRRGVQAPPVVGCRPHPWWGAGPNRGGVQAPPVVWVRTRTQEPLWRQSRPNGLSKCESNETSFMAASFGEVTGTKKRNLPNNFEVFVLFHCCVSPASRNTSLV